MKRRLILCAVAVLLACSALSRQPAAKADEIPPPPQICCKFDDTICCPARGTCVLCGLLPCCNPG